MSILNQEGDVFLGVCSYFAPSLGLKASQLRIGFVCLALLGGPVIIYFLLWLMIKLDVL